jgi:hypothetical protein
MTPAEKQKEIAVAFARYFNREVSKVSHITSRLLLILYENWLLTEEGKRLTAEEPEPRVIQGIWAVPEEKNKAAIASATKDRSEPEEPAINVLIKISKQLDRIEGRMDKMNGNLFAE